MLKPLVSSWDRAELLCSNKSNVWHRECLQVFPNFGSAHGIRELNDVGLFRNLVNTVRPDTHIASRVRDFLSALSHGMAWAFGKNVDSSTE